jgi:hypothetical protein
VADFSFQIEGWVKDRRHAREIPVRKLVNILPSVLGAKKILGIFRGGICMSSSGVREGSLPQGYPDKR